MYFIIYYMYKSTPLMKNVGTFLTHMESLDHPQKKERSPERCCTEDGSAI